MASDRIRIHYYKCPTCGFATIYDIDKGKPMSDTDILDGMQRHGIQVWPDMVKRVHASDEPNRISTWSTFAHDPRTPGRPVQKTRVKLRAALADTIEELEGRQ